MSGKLDNRRGEAVRAFNDGKTPKQANARSQSDQGRSPGSSKPAFERATKGERSGLDTPSKKHEAPEHMKDRAHKPDKVLKPKRMVMRRQSSLGLGR